MDRGLRLEKRVGSGDLTENAMRKSSRQVLRNCDG